MPQEKRFQEHENRGDGSSVIFMPHLPRTVCHTQRAPWDPCQCHQPTARAPLLCTGLGRSPERRQMGEWQEGETVKVADGETERDPLGSRGTRGTQVETTRQLALRGPGCRHCGLPGKDTEYPASVPLACATHTVHGDQRLELVPPPRQPTGLVGAQSNGTGGNDRLLFK